MFRTGKHIPFQSSAPAATANLFMLPLAKVAASDDAREIDKVSWISYDQ